MMTLTPTYGNDYKSIKEVRTALSTNKDFIINQFGHPYDGKPCNIRDLPDGTIKVRWNGLRSVGLFNPRDYK